MSYPRRNPTYIHRTPELKENDEVVPFTGENGKKYMAKFPNQNLHTAAIKNHKTYKHIYDHIRGVYRNDTTIDKDGDGLPLVDKGKWASIFSNTFKELQLNWKQSDVMYVYNINASRNPLIKAYYKLFPQQCERNAPRQKKVAAAGDAPTSTEKVAAAGDAPTGPPAVMGVECILNPAYKQDRTVAACLYVVNRHTNLLFKLTDYARHYNNPRFIPDPVGHIVATNYGGVQYIRGQRVEYDAYLNVDKRISYKNTSLPDNKYIYPLKQGYKVEIQQVENYRRDSSSSNDDSSSEEEELVVNRITIADQDYLIDPKTNDLYDPITHDKYGRLSPDKTLITRRDGAIIGTAPVMSRPDAETQAAEDRAVATAREVYRDQKKEEAATEADAAAAAAAARRAVIAKFGLGTRPTPTPYKPVSVSFARSANANNVDAAGTGEKVAAAEAILPPTPPNTGQQDALMQQATANLPSGWRATWSSTYGAPYWSNEQLGINNTWEKPVPGTDKERLMQRANENLPDGWRANWSTTHEAPYWSNEQLGINNTWEKPARPSSAAAGTGGRKYRSTTRPRSRSRSKRASAIRRKHSSRGKKQTRKTRRTR